MIRFSIFEFFSGENRSLKWIKNEKKKHFFVTLMLDIITTKKHQKSKFVELHIKI